ncbi:MAG: four helix bundle protein [Candidatus Paceibacterota bacterium]|jgi:four helix bundle protein
MEKEIYKRSCDFAISVIRFLKKINIDSANRVIAEQLIRSITSISANLAEGSAAVSKKEFINYVGIARKSAVETVHWLKFSHQIINREEIKEFINEGSQIVSILSKIVINSKNR